MMGIVQSMSTGTTIEQEGALLLDADIIQSVSTGTTLTLLSPLAYITRAWLSPILSRRGKLTSLVSICWSETADRSLG
jgi:hypothetical protein